MKHIIVKAELMANLANIAGDLFIRRSHFKFLHDKFKNLLVEMENEINRLRNLRSLLIEAPHTR